VLSAAVASHMAGTGGHRGSTAVGAGHQVPQACQQVLGLEVWWASQGQPKSRVDLRARCMVESRNRVPSYCKAWLYKYLAINSTDSACRHTCLLNMFTGYVLYSLQLLPLVLTGGCG